MTEEHTQNGRPEQANGGPAGGAGGSPGADDVRPAGGPAGGAEGPASGAGDDRAAAFDDEATTPGAGASVEETLRREAEESREQALRIAAELDNFRKRSARELENARKFGAERLAQALLPVRDSLEAGIEAAVAADAAPLADGQRATLRLLDDALASAGVREIDPHGEPFDPNKHEALSVVQAPDLEPGSVVQVIQKGYEMHDRLLRAARVIVAQSP